MRTAYEVFGQMYPALNARLDPADGLDELYRTSIHFRRQKDFAFAVLGGREKDNQPAEPLFRSDLFQLIRACPPTPMGYQSAAYLAVAYELGHRPAMFLMCFPGHVGPIGGGGWRFDGLYDVKTNNRYRDYTLGPLAAEQVANFKRCEDMAEWGTANRAFHYQDVVALDNDINERATHAGYPNWTFSSYSLRRGRVSEKIADHMFNGRTKVEAMDLVREDLGWATSGDTIQDYITPIGKWFLNVISH
jgi:hypothetical protein